MKSAAPIGHCERSAAIHAFGAPPWIATPLGMRWNSWVRRIGIIGEFEVAPNIVNYTQQPGNPITYRRVCAQSTQYLSLTH